MLSSGRINHIYQLFEKLMKKKLLVLSTLLTFQTTLAQSESLPVYLWDNQEGLVKATECEVVPSAETPFRISSYTGHKSKGSENLRNYNGVKQSHLINGSLIKMVEGRKRNNYQKIEVVGINTNTNEKINRWYSSRSDQGYLFKDSINSIEDYILEVEQSRFKDLNISTIFPSKSSFWLAETSSSYYNIKCAGSNENRDYSLFRVYSDLQTSTQPSAFVGVYKDETSIFSTLKTIKLSSLQENIESFEETYDLENLISNGENTVVEDRNVLDTQETFHQELRNSNTQNKGQKATVNETQGFFEEVVCLPFSTLNVRTESLEEVIFKANSGEKVKKFQSFDNETKDYVLDGISYEFIKVEFPNREEKDQRVGWVASNYIKQKSKCKYLRTEEDINQVKDIEITGIDDENCCEFPTVKATTHSYSSGMRRFNARRGGGTRTHAACDLYRYKNEPILSVAPGRIARNHYYFYQGTYAIEVVHSGGFVVRYGELSGKKVDGINHGSRVKMGQRIGYMGKVNSNCCRPMLHFELYKGTKSGPLSRSGNKYRRRSDLMDPTPYLKKWEIGKF
jgi:murein DD-endopeptidase MepM/ murein hydrolase activator NlpD